MADDEESFGSDDDLHHSSDPSSEEEEEDREVLPRILPRILPRRGPLRGANGWRTSSLNGAAPAADGCASSAAPRTDSEQPEVSPHAHRGAFRSPRRRGRSEDSRSHYKREIEWVKEGAKEDLINQEFDGHSLHHPEVQSEWSSFIQSAASVSKEMQSVPERNTLDGMHLYYRFFVTQETGGGRSLSRARTEGLRQRGRWRPGQCRRVAHVRPHDILASPIPGERNNNKGATRRTQRSLRFQRSQKTNGVVRSIDRANRSLPKGGPIGLPYTPASKHPTYNYLLYSRPSSSNQS